MYIVLNRHGNATSTSAKIGFVLGKTSQLHMFDAFKLPDTKKKHFTKDTPASVIVLEVGVLHSSTLQSPCRQTNISASNSRRLAPKLDNTEVKENKVPDSSAKQPLHFLPSSAVIFDCEVRLLPSDNRVMESFL